MRKKIILLADMESFYASVEVTRNPSLRGKPVAVCGDPERRHGIVLAATREAKACGIKTAMTAWECKGLCPEIVFVRPHMSLYIEVSVFISKILQRFSDRVFPYSIDEQFLDMTGCEKLFGSPEEMAYQIKKNIMAETGICCRIGIGENPLQAKMACDRFAKKGSSGIFALNHTNYSYYVWPLSIRNLFGVGSRMEKNFHRIGITKIGDLAKLPKENLKRRWGVNGEVLWLNAHGVDYSNISSYSKGVDNKGVGHSMTLPRDYRDKKEIEIVLLEITEEVCRRTRALTKMANVVSVNCKGADFDLPTGFSRQKKLSEPTAITMDIYPIVLSLFYTHWDKRPVRALGLNLSQLINDDLIQLSLFDDKVKKMNLSQSMDEVRNNYGPTSIFRVSSLIPGSQLFDRANKIGGHEA